jgi:hypothetical protein
VYDVVQTQSSSRFSVISTRLSVIARQDRWPVSFFGREQTHAADPVPRRSVGFQRGGSAVSVSSAAPRTALRRGQQIGDDPHRLGDEAEIRPHTALVALDDPGLGQDAQVVADGRLREPERFGQLGNAGLLLGSSLDQADELTGVSASTVTRTMIVFLPDWFQSALDTAALPLIQFQP